MSRSTHAPLIRKVDCLQLPVSDLEAGVAFYERLGHEVTGRYSAALREAVATGRARRVGRSSFAPARTERSGAR